MNMRFIRKPKQRLLILFVLILVTLSMLLFHHYTKSEPAPTQTIQKNDTPWTNQSFTWHRVTVSKGDSLARIFSKFQIGYHRVRAMLALPTAKKYLSKLYLGQTFYLHIDAKKNLIVLKYPIDNDKTLFVYHHGNVVKAIVQKQPMTTALMTLP